MRFVPAWEERYLGSYIEALREGFHMGNSGEAPPSEDELRAMVQDPRSWSDRERRRTGPVRLRDGQEFARAASTTLWWVDDRDFIGAVEIRHVLPSAVYAAYVGHFSVGVRPTRRGRRHGNQMEQICKQGLVEAGRIGVKRALVCCRTWNHASQAWIRASGGIHMDDVPVDYSGVPDVLRRFIIPIPDPEAASA